MRPLVLILGIDTVRAKTLYQTRWLAQNGYDVDVFAMHRDEGSVGADDSARIVAITSGPLGRVRQVVRYLRGNRARIHHVELYVGGRFAFVYALLCRLMRAPLIAVERGDLLQCQKRAYPLSARLSIYACYRLANRVWLREPYMARAFERWRVGGTFYLPNAVPLPPDSGPERTTDLLWVNRLVPERHPDWFAAAVAELDASCEIIGFSPGDPGPRVAELEAHVRAVLGSDPRTQLETFSDPVPAYERARFFVLPADVVFANFALLEAMAHGVVPVVSDVEGSSELVEHGSNGFLAEHSPAGLRAALEEALAVPNERWLGLSAAARATIAERFSVEVWGRALLTEYEAVAA
ncbi:MAG: glycosyltransferase [Thermoleophilaceae bacterium]|nr:glycosyltransferase [Thermoleophilaceae bacterium]